MAAKTFRFLVDCPECGVELITAPIELGVGKDGPVLSIDEIEKIHAYCPEDRLAVSLLAPDVKSDRVEVDE